jgi:hypothetical protein
VIADTRHPGTRHRITVNAGASGNRYGYIAGRIERVRTSTVCWPHRGHRGKRGAPSVALMDCCRSMSSWICRDSGGMSDGRTCAARAAISHGPRHVHSVHRNILSMFPPNQYAAAAPAPRHAVRPPPPREPPI